MFTEKKLLRDFDFFKKEDVALKKEYHHSRADFIISLSFMVVCLTLVGIFYPIVQEKNKTKIINEIRQEQSNEVLKNKDFYSLGISFLNYSFNHEISKENIEKAKNENFDMYSPEEKTLKEQLKYLLKYNKNIDIEGSVYLGNVNITSKVKSFTADKYFVTFEIEKIFKSKDESYKKTEIKIFDKETFEQKGFTKYISSN